MFFLVKLLYFLAIDMKEKLIATFLGSIVQAINFKRMKTMKCPVHSTFGRYESASFWQLELQKSLKTYLVHENCIDSYSVVRCSLILLEPSYLDLPLQIGITSQRHVLKSLAVFSNIWLLLTMQFRRKDCSIKSTLHGCTFLMSLAIHGCTLFLLCATIV